MRHVSSCCHLVFTRVVKWTRRWYMEKHKVQMKNVFLLILCHFLLMQNSNEKVVLVLRFVVYILHTLFFVISFFDIWIQIQILHLTQFTFYLFSTKLVLFTSFNEIFFKSHIKNFSQLFIFSLFKLLFSFIFPIIYLILFYLLFLYK